MIEYRIEFSETIDNMLEKIALLKEVDKAVVLKNAIASYYYLFMAIYNNNQKEVQIIDNLTKEQWKVELP